MSNKTKSEIIKILMNGLFVCLSYWIAERFQVTECIFHFSNSNWHTTVSIALYTMILNALLVLFLAKRTFISVKIVESHNESNAINLKDKPGVLNVNVVVTGNLKKIKSKIVIEFPKWVDPTVEGDPSIFQVNGAPYIYEINIADINHTSSYASKKFDFTVAVNEVYKKSGRDEEITALIKANRFRYKKETINLKVFNK